MGPIPAYLISALFSSLFLLYLANFRLLKLSELSSTHIKKNASDKRKIFRLYQRIRWLKTAYILQSMSVLFCLFGMFFVIFSIFVHFLLYITIISLLCGCVLSFTGAFISMIEATYTINNYEEYVKRSE